MGEDGAIRLEGAAAENGMAAIFKELISQNVARNPALQDVVRRLRLVVGFKAPDIALSLTMVFDGRLSIHDGLRSDAHAHITADADTLLDLTRMSFCAGVPWLFDEKGRTVAGKFLRGALKVKGMLRNPRALIALLRLFSVS